MPKDVRTSLFMRGTLTILRPIAWYVFFILLVFQYVIFGKYEVRLTNPLVYIAIVLIVFLPFWLKWISKAYSCRAFSGKIEDIQKQKIILTNYNFTSRKNHGDAYHAMLMKFSIRDEKGKCNIFSILEPSFIDINYFKVGDEVRHIFGSKFLEKVSKSADNEVICLVCGVMSHMDNDFCFNCRHTLVKRSGKYTNQ